MPDKNDENDALLAQQIDDAARSLRTVDFVAEPKIGEHYLIMKPKQFFKELRFLGCEAKILEKRTVIDDQDKLEYYVHYVNMDKRLDEWTTNRCILPLSAAKYIPGKLVKLAKSFDEEDENRKLTRQRKRRHDDTHHVQKSLEELDPRTAELEKAHEEMTKVKYIENVMFGTYLFKAWYYSPFPDEYEKLKTIHICEYCLKYMKYQQTLTKHQAEGCTRQYPPGKVIYCDGPLRLREIDGEKEQLYCQFVCLMAKLFLDHKTLYFDVDGFLFYILTEVDSDCIHEHIVGYFSKEKLSFENNNLACIMVLPSYQRQGYGQFLIQASYAIAAIEKKIGSPEKPLSDLGKASYRTFWAWKLLVVLDKIRRPCKVPELSRISGIAEVDILDTLSVMGMTKYWRGEYIVCVTEKIVADALAQMKPPKLKFKPSALKWKPIDWEAELARRQEETGVSGKDASVRRKSLK